MIDRLRACCTIFLYDWSVLKCCTAMRVCNVVITAALGLDLVQALLPVHRGEGAQKRLAHRHERARLGPENGVIGGGRVAETRKESALPSVKNGENPNKKRQSTRT